jgi:iron complex transport system ATP-binding protein
MTLELAEARYAVAGKLLVDGVNLIVRPGWVLAVLGPNGAGKSTVLALIAGDLSPASGAARLDGRPIARWSRRELALRRAVMPQSSQLVFDFLVRDVVAMGRAAHDEGPRNPVLRRAVEAAMAAADITHLADRVFPTLSGGEKQRVQLARALAQIWPGDTAAGSPAYLLLDEPTASLDLAHQAQVLGAARRLAAAGLGVLAVLHDLNLAALFADEVALLAGGRLVASGAPGEVLTPSMIEQVFGARVLRLAHPHRRDRPIMVLDPLPPDAEPGRS